MDSDVEMEDTVEKDVASLPKKTIQENKTLRPNNLVPTLAPVFSLRTTATARDCIKKVDMVTTSSTCTVWTGRIVGC